MHLVFRGLYDREAVNLVVNAVSPEVLEERGEMIAEVMQLKKTERTAQGKATYHTGWGPKTAEGVYASFLSLFRATSEIGSDYRYGIHDEVSDSWWQVQDEAYPIIFENYEHAMRYLFDQRQLSDKPIYGDVKVYRNLVAGELNRDLIAYSRLKDEQEAFNKMQLVHFKIAKLLFDRDPLTACSTQIQGHHFFLHYDRDTRYVLRMSLGTRIEKMDFWEHGMIEGQGIDDIQAAINAAEAWLQNPTFVV